MFRFEKECLIEDHRTIARPSLAVGKRHKYSSLAQLLISSRACLRCLVHCLTLQIAKCRPCCWAWNGSPDDKIHEIVVTTKRACGEFTWLQKYRVRTRMPAPPVPLAIASYRNKMSHGHFQLSRNALTADTIAFYQAQGYICSEVLSRREGSRIKIRAQLVPCADSPVRFKNSNCRTRPSTMARALGLRPNQPFRMAPEIWKRHVM